MPVSNYSNVGPIMNNIRVLHRQQPINTVLDIGIGFGKYGFMLREFLDIRVKRYNKEDWKATIDGIEAYAPYVNNLHKFIYDRVYVGDVMEIYPTLPPYDLIIMSEVIEHLDKDDGMKLLLHIRFNNALIITTPQVFSPRSGYDWENTYERHISLWRETELRVMFPDLKVLTRTAFIVSNYGN
jgi:hypothetical protein